MNIGLIKEIKQDEYRVGLTPSSSGEYIRNGHNVLVEQGAGLGSGFSDEAYKNMGCTIGSKEAVFEKSDMIIKVKEPLEQEYPLFREGQILYTYLHLAANMHHIPDTEGQQQGLLTVHRTLSYSLTLGFATNLCLSLVKQLAGLAPDEAALKLAELLMEELWTKEKEEVGVTAGDGFLHVEYSPHLVIHTRRFEISFDIPFGNS